MMEAAGQVLRGLQRCHPAVSKSDKKQRRTPKNSRAGFASEA